ncbi:hypothetical protein ACUTR7_24970 [Delftia sp. NA_296.1]|uniref:hypothetical protein n=1 Tax=Delftia sp. NA_296.1 TaxID=3415648 RepID=UPI0040456E15
MLSSDWKRQGPAQFRELTDSQRLFFPIGYWDVATQAWVLDPRQKMQVERGWTPQAYSDFMSAALKRRTFAPMRPPAEVLTLDGFIMEENLEVMFVGGKVLHRHHWDTRRLLGRKMIAWHRFGSWHLRGNSMMSYGDGYIKVLEHGPHSTPLAWCVVPDDEDDPFLIEGRSFVSEFSYLYIEDPGISLMTIDGRRISPVRRPAPQTELPVSA